MKLGEVKRFIEEIYYEHGEDILDLEVGLCLSSSCSECSYPNRKTKPLMGMSFSSAVQEFGVRFSDDIDMDDHEQAVEEWEGRNNRLEIKPCPFCGSEEVDTSMFLKDKTFGYYCLCYACGAEGPNSDNSKKKAILLWNHPPRRNEN